MEQISALSNIKSWAEFQDLAAQQKSEKAKGNLFELLTKCYLLLEPKYSTKLSDVWLWNEIPASVKEGLLLN